MKLTVIIDNSRDPLVDLINHCRHFFEFHSKNVTRAIVEIE